MYRVSVLSLLAAGVVACLALGTRPAAAQDLRPAAVQDLKAANEPGVWVNVGMLGGGAVLDGNASRGWEQVGHPGPSVGGSLALGYDGTRFGGAIDGELAALKVGGRQGSSLAVAVTARWHVPMRPASRWQPIAEIGYVQLGFGSARVTEAEVPPGLFKSGVQGDQGTDNDLSLNGKGIRLGVSLERAWRLGTNVVLGLGADAVHFDGATYEGNDKSLTRPGWGVMPRLLFGVRIPAKLGSGTIVSEPI